MDTLADIPRAYFSSLKEDVLQSGKIIMLYGPRQVGKTTLAKKLLADLPLKKLELNADIHPYEELLGARDLERLKGLVGDHELVFIDEAQRIPDIGINLKILRDHFPHLKLLVTGSSSFELANQTREALTGRTLTYLLYPISAKELTDLLSPFELEQQVENFLTFGMYPEILSLTGREKKIRYLRELVSSYLYKDILALTNIKHADKLRNLLRLLAFQLGSEVSLNELGRQLGMAKETVESYLDLLEKSFVIFRLGGFSRNLRKEVTKMSKYYFFDLGVRNTVIENYQPLELRGDVGQLWENFLLLERMKKQAYNFEFSNRYFWRTYDQQEIDYLEQREGTLSAFEFKFQEHPAKIPKAWAKAYPEADFSVIHRRNFLKFIS